MGAGVRVRAQLNKVHGNWALAETQGLRARPPSGRHGPPS
jgi:hypothetical protein